MYSHRLSTITAADQILCLHAGQVVEAGTHEELLQLKGRYANMWRKQIRAERAAEEARVLKDRAEKLRQESAHGAASGDTSDNEVDSHGHREGGGHAGRSGLNRESGRGSSEAAPAHDEGHAHHH